MNASRVVLFRVALLVITYVMIEVFCGASLWALHAAGRLPDQGQAEVVLTEPQRNKISRMIADEGKYFTFSAALGWTIRPGGEAGPYRANAQGIRSDREYDLIPPPGVLRVAIFGDSFTHGTEVDVSETWQAKLEAGNSGLEVLNFGVDAYGLDQAILRYEHDGMRFAPHVVLAALMSENINRHVNVFRPLYFPTTGAPFTKPRFVLEGPGLAWYRIRSVSSPAIAHCSKTRAPWSRNSERTITTS